MRLPDDFLKTGFAVQLTLDFESAAAGRGLRLSQNVRDPLKVGQCAGVYMATKARRSLASHNALVEANPAVGEYAMVLRIPGQGPMVIYASPNRCNMGRVNEGPEPNIAFRDVDIPLDDHTTGVVLAGIITREVQPGGFLCTDYGPSYERIREWRKYKDPCPNRGDAPKIDELGLAAEVTRAFGKDNLSALVQKCGAYSVQVTGISCREPTMITCHILCSTPP